MTQSNKIRKAYIDIYSKSNETLRLKGDNDYRGYSQSEDKKTNWSMKVIIK